MEFMKIFKEFDLARAWSTRKGFCYPCKSVDGSDRPLTAVYHGIIPTFTCGLFSKTVFPAGKFLVMHKPQHDSQLYCPKTLYKRQFKDAVTLLYGLD